MLNKVVLIGRLTRDPDMRFTQSQRAVCSFNLAVNRNFTTQSGEREADFINIVCWGRTAENVSKFLSKGSLVAVDGRIQTRNYDNAQGQRVYVTEVVAESVTFLESRNSNSNNIQDYGFVEPKQETNTASKEASFDSNKDPFADFGNSIDISDDDLPF
ncbi:MAG: single-stranded DNA-binding protein [Bacilli bacterium]